MDQEQAFLALLSAGANHCVAVVDGHGSLLLSLLLTGLVGGLTHCTAMCGPFVLSQVQARMEAIPASRMREWHRLAGAALVPYQLGRLTTYAALGAIGAALAGSLKDLSGLRWLSAGLLVFAALLLIGYALPRFKLALPGGKVAEQWWSGRVGRLARPLFSAPTGGKGYLLGLLLGFIPCGLLYGALAASAATGDPLAGAFGMTVFALGTMPNLIGVGLAGHLAGSRFREAFARAAPVLLLFNAAVLSWMAVTLVA